MDGDVAEVKQASISPCEPKMKKTLTSISKHVHDAICCKLMKVSEKIINILPAIESARPGSSSGIQVLCSLNNTVEKAKLLVCYCAESSKLYLAITAESITLRCQRIITNFNQSLHQIQTMVPPLLASKISEVLVHLRDVEFIVDPGEDEAGKALLNLLAQTDSCEDQEFQIFQFVTSRLNISSSIALLVERRSIKKLLDKFQGVDKKERILKYFLYLLKKYGKQLKPDGMEYNENSFAQDNCLNVINSKSDACKLYDTDLPHPNNVEVESEFPSCEVPPEEFCCSISSRLMYDPVVIVSGQTYERIWIEKWFSEGYDTCPKTQKKLKNLSVIPNSYMKDLISNWCKKHGVIVPNPCTQSKEAAFDLWQSAHSNSVSSLKNVSAALLDGAKSDCLNETELWKMSVMSSGDSFCSYSSPIKPIQSSNNNHDQLFSWSDDYQRYQSFSNFSRDMYLRFLFGLSGLPTLLQENVMEHLKNLLEGDEMTCEMLSIVFAEALMLFLKKSHALCDIAAQRCGAQIFLALINNRRWELSFLNVEFFQLLSSFFNYGIDDDVLMILQKLVQHPNFMSYIVASSIPLDLVHYLYSGENKYVEIIVKILSDLSFHGEMRYLFMSSKCIEKFCQLFCDRRLVRFCLNILHNLSEDEEASRMIADANGCITSIAEVLESGNHEEQEQAVTILLALCSSSLRNCALVLKEGAIPSLVHISVNGNAKAKENSMKLLHVLREIGHCVSHDNPRPYAEPGSDLVEHTMENSKNVLPKYKFFGFFRRKKRYPIKSLALS